MEKLSIINIIIYVILGISILSNIYLMRKKRKKIMVINPNDYKNIGDVLELLYFNIDFHVTTSLNHQKNVLGKKNINTELFKELYVQITRDVYSSLSREYKVLLLKIFSQKGLNTFVIKKVESYLIEYMRKNSMI